ncbi:transcriptional regulator [Kitasatospora sp. NPDC088779]|uniref:transcriptional regulator n=1 Tax=Kitasatospora sp. NPDC088779 TaxID=3154964 RepID=UPI00341EFC50
MTRDYGRPPRAEENRASVEFRLRELSEAGGLRETVTIDWRGNLSSFDVIEMSVGDLYYNPATHRIRAQRSHDADRDLLLEADPWSAESQAYLDFLLKAVPADPSRPDPEFDKLADSLVQYGQNDAGLITRDGVLVNGNTRRAALLQRYGPTQVMRVGVLPASCSWGDIASVELALQLRKDHRREYSYINRLLAIDELVSQGVALASIATTFRTTQEACRRDQWVYNLIRSMVRRSEADGRALPLIAFEDHAEKLRELHRKVAKEEANSPEKADLMLELRLAAAMLGFSKTDLRLIEADFQGRYLANALPSGLQPVPSSAGAVRIPGLSRTVKGPSDAVAAARVMTDAVLQAKAVSSAHLPTGSQEAVRAADTLRAYKDAFESSLEFAGKDARVRKRKQAAPTRLADASQAIDQCVTDLVMSRASRSLDEDAFDDAVAKLRRSLGKLAIEVKRTVSEPGDETSWLIGLLDKGH